MPAVLRALMALIAMVSHGIRAITVLITSIFHDGMVKVTLHKQPAWLHLPSLRVLPMMAGADDDEDEDDDEEELPGVPATPVDEEEDDDEETPPPDDDPAEWDRDRAKRTIEKQRKAEKAAKRRAEAAEAKVKELEDAQLSDQEKVIRERDEAKADAQRARDSANRLIVNEAIREAALEAGVPPKRLKRVLKLIDRDDLTIEVDGDGEPTVDGVEDALTDLLDDIPELKADPTPPPDDEDDDPPHREPPGGGPDRKRKVKPMTAAQVAQMAKDDPVKFNELFEAGKLTTAQLGG